MTDCYLDWPMAFEPKRGEAGPVGEDDNDD